MKFIKFIFRGPAANSARHLTYKSRDLYADIRAAADVNRGRATSAKQVERFENLGSAWYGLIFEE